MSLILGIECGTRHDSGATILFDNKIIASIEEERLSSAKHDGSYSLKSMDFCVDHESVKYSDVKKVIIVRFQDKSEIGSRALGSRSILTDQRKLENQNIINTKIKFREEFRPFVPSVLEEYIFDWLELEIFSPYMLLITQAKHQKRNLIPAVTNVDGTARPQTANKELNYNYYSLINYFYKLSNCPIVLNATFNLARNQFVNRSEDTVQTLFNSGIDFLIIENFLIFNNNLEKIKDLLDETIIYEIFVNSNKLI